MQHAWKHVERPGGSHTALDGKKGSHGVERCAPPAAPGACGAVLLRGFRFFWRDMKRISVEINHDAPQWSHHAVWNRRYMDPKPGYTLQQLWADSEPAIGKKTSPSYEIKTNDVLRAVAAIQHLPSPTPPDSPFLRALGTSAALKAPPQN